MNEKTNTLAVLTEREVAEEMAGEFEIAGIRDTACAKPVQKKKRYEGKPIVSMLL